MLSQETLDLLSNMYNDRTVFLVGCMALGLGDKSCYYDIAVYPGKGIVKMILNFKENVIVIPINSHREFLKKNTVLIHASSFDYQYVVEHDPIKYYRKKALDALKKAMENYLLSKNGGNAFLKASIMNVVDALLLINKTEPAPSHIFKQISELNNPELSFAIEVAKLDENLGSLLKVRANLVLKELGPADSTVFSEKIDHFMAENRQVEASAYLYHKLSQFPNDKLTMLNQRMKLGLSLEKDSKDVLSIIKKASDKLSMLI
ncbi:MAG: hypothetical protein QXH39_05115 [Conexivisphaerales archaeon]